MRLIVIRHGQTDENKEMRYLGHNNSALNEKGRKQIQALVGRLKKVEVSSLCYSSDLLRAVETSELIGKEWPLVIERCQELRELHFGDWDCYTYDEISKKDPELLKRWISNPFEISPPNGETLYELGARVDQWIKQKILLGDDKDCLVVSHGGPIRWILSKWIRNDEHQFWHVNNVHHGEGLMINIDKVTKKWNIEKELTFGVS